MMASTSQPSGSKAGEELDLEGVQLPLEPLYHLCLKYYKENNGKIVSVTYEVRNKLIALTKQIAHGKYKVVDGQEPGLLDVVGNDRKIEWQALGEMDRPTAMKEFVRLLYKCSPSLKPYVIAFQVQKQEEERERREAEQRAKHQAEEEARQQQSAQVQANSEYEQQIRAALNQQTYTQFTQYAAQLHPNDTAQQAVTVKQLQDQHFAQYLQQAYEQQIEQQKSQEAMQPNKPHQPPNQPSAPTPSENAGSVTLPGAQADQLSAKMNNVNLNGDHQTIINNVMANTTIPNNVPTSSDSTESQIEEASMWTQKTIANFKTAVKKESKKENHSDCIIKVGSGETVTIRVPTHDNGNCLFWEFATDHYDIAFGVYFEWTNTPDSTVQIQVSESSSDEDEAVETSAAGDDPEKASSKRNDGPVIDEIVPIYRRDSHEEVYCGSHVYPGRGVYLLKFDNSYSLWRSKTLYYRVYYSR